MTDYVILKEIFEQHQKFVLTTHVNPDADALGSELAIYSILKKLNKEVRIINHSYTPYNLEFLDGDKTIEKYDESIHDKLIADCEVIVFLDLNQFNRVVRMESSVAKSDALKVCIDHHQNPDPKFDHYFGSTEYSSTGEVIYDFIEQTGITELDYFIALQIYAAIMTDTGSFRFDRTTPRVHRIIADLLEKGVDPTNVYNEVFEKGHFSRVKLLGDALNSINLSPGKEIATMIITRLALEKNNAVEADVDGFVNYCLSINGVKIGILFYELKDGLKISFRSKGSIPVNKLAAEFGGGGHLNASGTRMTNTTLDSVYDDVLKAAEKYLNNSEE